ncbi:hypothetical protein pb186bvf_009533 [Paramecium bursaria]
MNWNKIKQENQGPSQRWGHSSVIIDEKLYIFGGFIDSKYYNELHQFDFESKQWDRLETYGQIPKPRSNHIMFNYQGKILIHGGGGQHKYRFQQIHLLDLNTHIWETLQTSSKPRTYHSGCIGEDNLFMYGGEGETHDLDCLEIINLKYDQQLHFEQLGENPQSRRFASMEYYNGQLVLIGGCTDAYQERDQIFLGELKKELQFTWTKINITFQRWGHNSFQYNGSIYVFGGRAKGKDYNSITKLDLEQLQYSQYEPNQPIHPRRRGSLSISGNTIVVFGGFGDAKYYRDFNCLELPLKNFNIQNNYQEISWFDFDNYFFDNDNIKSLEDYDSLIYTDDYCFGCRQNDLLKCGYFQALFKFNQSYVINLSIDSLSFSIVLIFITKGQLILPILVQDELFRLLKLIDYLDIHSMRIVLISYIFSTVDSDTIKNLFNLAAIHDEELISQYCAILYSEKGLPLKDINSNLQQQILEIDKIRRLALLNK